LRWCMWSGAVFYGSSADLSTSAWLSSNFNAIFWIYSIQLKTVAKARKEEPAAWSSSAAHDGYVSHFWQWRRMRITPSMMCQSHQSNTWWLNE
jgi:hypothetical protein